jgi:methylenetetrahydrofolate dehydrogenase (NADP+)/methenyltetrahydrofolate cyclohydrolase
MIVDGKEIQQNIKSELVQELSSLSKSPKLSIIYVGSNSVTDIFVSLKEKFGADIGVEVETIRFDEDIEQESLVPEIAKISEESDGVVVQLPLPKHLEEQKILSAIPVEKDVDVLNPETFELFAKNEINILPPVTGAIFEVLDRYNVSLLEKNIVVVGEGKLVGLPTKIELEKRGVNPSMVTLETPAEEKEKLFKEADVIVLGAGDPHFLKRQMVKKGVVIIDAGTSEKGGKLEGDACPSCSWKAQILTPVPGGIGPITIAVLFKNLITLCTQ